MESFSLGCTVQLRIVPVDVRKTRLRGPSACAVARLDAELHRLVAIVHRIRAVRPRADQRCIGSTVAEIVFAIRRVCQYRRRTAAGSLLGVDLPVMVKLLPGLGLTACSGSVKPGGIDGVKTLRHVANRLGTPGPLRGLRDRVGSLDDVEITAVHRSTRLEWRLIDPPLSIQIARLRMSPPGETVTLAFGLRVMP